MMERGAGEGGGGRVEDDFRSVFTSTFLTRQESVGVPRKSMNDVESSLSLSASSAAALFLASARPAAGVSSSNTIGEG